MGESKYLVVAIVMAIIFTGLAIYLIILDRKLTRMEKKQSDFIETNKKS